MKAIDSLLHDHERFRLLLDALDAALGLCVDTQFVVRELCFTLSVRLRDHMRREGELIGSCHGPLSAKELTALAEGHGDEAHSLHQALTGLTETDSAHAMARVQGVLELAVVQFRYHLDAQEYKLFPALAWSLKEEVAAEGEDEVAACSGYSAANPMHRWEGVL